MADGLSELYDKYNLLSDAKSKEKISELVQEYEFCISSTKQSGKEKKLTAQIISQFFKYFPDLQHKAIDVIIDLCEDDGDKGEIRIAAMNVLPQLCKEAKTHIPKISDILAQLLQLTTGKDNNVAANCLLQVFKEDPLPSLNAIFNLIHSTDEPRETIIQFVFKKLAKLEDKLTPEINDMLLEHGKKILEESTGMEFSIVTPFLISSKLAKTTTGQQEIVNLVAERAEIDRDFEPLDEENVNADRLLMCVESILPLFNAHVASTKFVKYYCDQVLPKWVLIGNLKNGSIIQYQFLKQLAELSTHCGPLEEPLVQVKEIFDLLKQFMPQPPEDVDIEKIPNLDFTSVECLLYAFHRLARQCPEFLTADVAVLKDFRARLNYFSRGVGGCKKSLDKMQIKTKDDDKIKIAPAVLDNITSLIKDLFYTNPVYKCNVQLSFKTIDKKIKISPEKSALPQKRHVPISFDSSNGSTTHKQIRSNKGTDNVKLYTPPSGKFSNSFQSYDRSGTRGRGRGGRGIRGSRGSSRGWRN